MDQAMDRASVWPRGQSILPQLTWTGWVTKSGQRNTFQLWNANRSISMHQKTTPVSVIL